MQIIWNQEAAEKLSASQTVLELETFPVNGQMLTSYCVVPAEKIFPEIAKLEESVNLHKRFITELNQRNYTTCQELIPHLLGRFGGELDSFYEHMLGKINNEQSSA